MTLLKRILYVIVVITVVVLALAFGIRNKDVINVDFIFVQVSSMGLGFWLLTSLITGVILGWLLSVPNALLLKLSIKQIKHKVKNQSDELLRLKGSFLKGN